MHLRYDPQLIEAAVFLEAHRRENTKERLLALRYAHQREKLYDVRDPDERNDAFFQFHRRWFQEFGLEDRLQAVLNEFPLLEARAATLLLRKARLRKEEGAELFVRPDARNVVIALCPERFLPPDISLYDRTHKCPLETLEEFLRHELTHISDMLDPAFAYEPEILLPDMPPAENTLLRERYRVLWDCSIDGRWKREPLRAARRAELNKAFGHLSAERRQELFTRLWDGPRPTHGELFAWSKKQRLTAPNLPGAACPLCRFPTFAWADMTKLSAATVGAIQKHFPRWEPSHGACGRCVEVYESARFEVPATLYL